MASVLDYDLAQLGHTFDVILLDPPYAGMDVADLVLFPSICKVNFSHTVSVCMNRKKK